MSDHGFPWRSGRVPFRRALRNSRRSSYSSHSRGRRQSLHLFLHDLHNILHDNREVCKGGSILWPKDGRSKVSSITHRCSIPIHVSFYFCIKITSFTHECCVTTCGGTNILMLHRQLATPSIAAARILHTIVDCMRGYHVYLEASHRQTRHENQTILHSLHATMAVV